MTELNAKRIKAAHALDGDLENTAVFYRNWARAYDEDLREADYAAPEVIVGCLGAAADHADVDVGLQREEVSIIDVGCGTGLVGAALRARGIKTTIDGLDLSREMVDRARERGLYRELWGGQVLQGAARALAPRRYDVALACGVFTLGHVPPTELPELFALVRDGGLAIVSARKSYADQTDLLSVIAAIERRGQAVVVERILDAPYTRDERAHYWAFRVTSDV